MNKFAIPFLSFVAGMLVATVFFRSPGNQHLARKGDSETVTQERSSDVESDSNREERPSTPESGESSKLRSNANETVLLDDELADAALNNGESVEQSGLEDSPGLTGRTASTRGRQRQRSEVRDPVPVAEEVAPFLEDDPKAAELHDQMETQARDESWAAYMEAQISAYLVSKPSLAGFRIALVQCRVSICEIQAIGYGPDAQVVWFTAVADMPDQPWFEFNDGTYKMSEFGPDVTSILMQFAQQKADSTVNATDSVASRS